MIKVDVIIPVYRPSQGFLQLLEMLDKQTLKAEKIILINTEQKYFDELTEGMNLLNQYHNLVIRHISKEEFNHGRTRNLGVSLSDSPFFIMMTDDALPVDEKLIERLLAPFEEESVGMTYARQVPARGCGGIESYTRSFNYPAVSHVYTAKDLPTKGIKTFFASNVCAAYRKSIFQELGGFIDNTIFNEDMIYARGVINKGCGIAYAADACVSHSHNYSGLQQFERNFDLGVSHAQHPEVFANLSTESEGIRLVKQTCAYLLREKKPLLILKLVWLSGCKYAGYFLGKRYGHLPKGLVRLFSMNKGYWK